MSDTTLYPRADEIGVLGCAMYGGLDLAIEASSLVPVDAIFDDDIRESYGIAMAITGRGEPCDIQRMSIEWERRHGASRIPAVLWGEAGGVAWGDYFLSHYAAGVLDGYRRRRAREMGALLAQRAGDAGITTDDLMGEAEAVLAGHESQAVDILDGRQAAKACLDDLEARYRRQGAVGGIETGYRDYDRMADGLQPGEQTIFAARPSIGKTAIALGIAEHACLRGNVPTLFVTLEMSPGSLMRRMASSWCNVPMKSLRLGQLTDRDFLRLAAYNTACASAPIYIADGVAGLTVASICAIIRRAVRKHGVKLVIIDYLQKIQATTKHEKRTYEVAEVSGRLKAIAAKTGVAMLTLAQLNRESEKDKRPPRLSDLADSGQIERDADLVALLHRDRGGENAHHASLIIAKQRDGETGCVKLHFDGAHCKFTSSSMDDQ